MQSQITDMKSPLLLRLYQGELSLPVTFWFFGVILSNILFLFITLFVEENPIREPALIDLLGQLLISIISIVYLYMVCVGIWRSAGKHKGRRVWAHLARLQVLLAAGHIFLSIIGL